MWLQGLRLGLKGCESYGVSGSVQKYKRRMTLAEDRPFRPQREVQVRYNFPSFRGKEPCWQSDAKIAVCYIFKSPDACLSNPVAGTTISYLHIGL